VIVRQSVEIRHTGDVRSRKDAVRRFVSIDGHELPDKKWRRIRSIRQNRRRVYRYQALVRVRTTTVLPLKS
jgi:hypothetical protein